MSALGSSEHEAPEVREMGPLVFREIQGGEFSIFCPDRCILMTGWRYIYMNKSIYCIFDHSSKLLSTNGKEIQMKKFFLSNGECL